MVFITAPEDKPRQRLFRSQIPWVSLICILLLSFLGIISLLSFKMPDNYSWYSPENYRQKLLSVLQLFDLNFTSWREERSLLTGLRSWQNLHIIGSSEAVVGFIVHMPAGLTYHPVCQQSCSSLPPTSMCSCPSSLHVPHCRCLPRLTH